MQNNIRKAFVAALLAVAAFGVSLAAPGGAAPGMPRPPWAQPDGVATATSVKTTTARLGSLRRDDTVVVAVEGVVADPGVDTNAVRAIVEEYCGTNIVPRVDAVESGLSDVEEWQRTNGLYSAVAVLGDSVSAALAAKADGTVVERGVYSPAMDTNDVWVVDTDGTVLRFSDADPAAGTVTWRGVCASNTLWVSGSATNAPPEVVYSLTTLETDATRVLASVAVVDTATGARCGIPRSAFGGTGDDVAYLAPGYDQAGPGDLQYSYTATVRPLGSGVLVFGRTDSGVPAEVVRLSRSRIVDAETSVVYDADLRRRLAELRAAVVSRDAATSGFTEWAVSMERPVTGEVVVAAFPAGSAPSGACDWSLFYADDAVRDDSTRLADVKRASSAATNLVWAASETSWGISVTACRVRVPTVADIEGVQAVAGKHYDDASAMFAKLLHYATNNYYSAYLANERAKNLEAWQYTNAVGRADVERGMTDWAMTPMWPIGYVDAAQLEDGADAGKWSLFPTGATHTASNALLPAIDGAKNRFGDVVELLWPDASWRVEERWTNSLDKLGFRWTPDPGDGYVTAHFDARATRTRVVTMEDVYSLSTNMAQTVTGLVGGVSERLDRLGADLASAARLSLPGECFPVTYMAGSSPPVTIGGADGLSFREDGGVVRVGDAASGRYICSFDPGTLRFLESPYGDALLFGRGYSPGASNEWPVLSVAACGASVVPAGRTVNGKALTNDVTLTGADIPVDASAGAQKIDAALDGKADHEKPSYSDSWDVYEQHAGGYVFLTGLHTSTTGGGAFTIYGQTDAGYDHGERLLCPYLGKFYAFLVACHQTSTNEFDVSFFNSRGELDRLQSDSDPRVPGASFTAGDYKYVYNGLTTNTVVYSDGLTSVERIARAAAARVDDVHAVSTNALAQATNAVAQVDSLAASKADRTRQSRYGVWYMYAAGGPLLETLQYSVSDGRWHGESFTLWYSPERGTWLYTNGFGSPVPLPGDPDATRLDAARSTFRRDRGLVPVVYSDDTVAPSASAAAGAPAEARAVDAALSGKVSKAGDTMAGDLTFGVDYGIIFGDNFAPSKIRSWWDNPDDGMIFNFDGGNDGKHRVQLFCTRPGRIALTAGRGHEGNLASLDAEGNFIDSRVPVGIFSLPQYYPDGSVKSAEEFTPGIKYTFTTDTTGRTAMVKPFCGTGDSANDNSDLVGRVVIPPFVDAQGNGYISDDGTRYKVVGVGDAYIPRSNVNLTAIVAPSTVTTIGDYAFAFCPALSSVSLPAAASVRVHAFSFCTGLTSVLLPATVSIGGSAFGNCDSLTSVSLPAATNIAAAALSSCTSLTSVSLPAAASVGNRALADCTSLTSVSLPAVTSIGNGVFFDCSSLASVDFGGTPRSSVPTLGVDAFYGVPASCKIIVPDAQYDAWTAATLPDGSSNRWYTLVTAGYTFLRHSEWEYARRYEMGVILAGQFMPETPTQNELAEAVKKIFVALGGTITNGTQNVEAGRGLE